MRPSIPETTEFEEKKLSNLVMSGHQAADGMQTEKAKNLYLESYKLYLGLPDSKKESAYSTLNHLHEKLTVLGLIEAAQDALDTKKLDEFKDLLPKIIALKNSLVEGTILSNYFSSTLQYFEGRVL
jgi:hypothetical protein